MSHDYIHEKLFLELLSPKKYEIDLSNEILNFDFGQGAAKISTVKVGG